jgi:ABC-type nickel/cobalt efflux system permease component RcnA
MSSATSLPGALVLALLLGLRHATDPDHLVAVSTLVAGARERGARSAGWLGAAWGAGHALALVALGLPILLLGLRLSRRFEQVTEGAIGVLIVLLALRLLQRWRRGAFHAHEHDHEGHRHVHLHAHGDGPLHEHDHPPPRTPLMAFLVGCVHGMGGSAAVGILILGSATSPAGAAAALVVLAIGAAISMAALSAGFGLALTTTRIRRRLREAIPVLGGWGVLFGAWYALGAWSLVPYPL